MFFLVLCMLFLWNMCWYINVVDAQPGDQSLKHEEYQMGFKQCEERCLGTGDCRGFSYDSSALRCTLAFDEGNYQYKSTTKQCGTSWCKSGEKCLTTRKFFNTCVWYMTQERAKEKDNLSLKEVKLDLTYVGIIKTDKYNFVGCTTTKFLTSNNTMYILNSNQLLAVDLTSAEVLRAWPIENSHKFQLTGLAYGWCKIHIFQPCFSMIVTSSGKRKVWLASIALSTIFADETGISLTHRKALKLDMKGKHLHLHTYKEKVYLVSRRDGIPYSLFFEQFQLKGNAYKLKGAFRIRTDNVSVSSKPFNFFTYDRYVFVIVKNVLYRWRVKSEKPLKIYHVTKKMYRWDSVQETIWLAQDGETLYTIDAAHHLRRTEMEEFLRQLYRCDYDDSDY